MDYVCDTYLNNWPDWNDRHRFLKPERLLPAPKEVVAKALRREYEHWPEKIDWTVFSAFFTEYVDLARFVSEADFKLAGKFSQGNSLFALWIPMSSIATFSQASDYDKLLSRVSTGVQRSALWNPQGAADEEIDRLRTLLMNCIEEHKALNLEWREFIASIGRDTYS